jgi:hypothetical protein
MSVHRQRSAPRRLPWGLVGRSALRTCDRWLK